MKYEVYVSEQRNGTMIVEANNEKEAKQKVIAECDKYKGIPADCYIDDVTIEIVDCVEA